MGAEQGLVTKKKPTNFQQEREAIATRRGKTPLADDDKTYGLALSGGGIRSATFSLGVVRALAKQGKLQRYDYLSTVSGGGYLGGMLGRLYQVNSGRKVQQALANDNTILLAWLRNNGRYLIPAGWHDISLALTQMLRSFFSALLLVTLLCVLVSGIVIWSEKSVNYASHIEVIWLAVAPLIFCGWLIVFYWLNTDCFWMKVIILICSGMTSAAYFHFILPDYPRLVYASGTAVACCILILIWLMSGGTTLADFRLRLTRATMFCLGITLAIASLWGINRSGNYLNTHASTLVLMLTPPSFVLFVRLLREIKLVSKMLAAISARGPKYQFSLMQAGNILGLVLLAATLVTVCAAEMRFISSPHLWLNTEHHYLPPLFPIICSVVILAFFAVLCCTPMMIAFLNQSSLHHLYRARLERAWLSVANIRRNGNRNARFSKNPLRTKKPGDMDSPNIAKVTECLPDDDICFTRYRPQKNGPVHLITCCINQTIDDRSGNYNADRKGIGLTLSAFGAEVGTREPEASSALNKTMLSQWIAISGAAFASGMGSRTQPGTAFLLFLTGGRLGYWSPNLFLENKKLRTLKFALFYEMFARFPGLGSNCWYLSDGGHFENTGVYPLLKRRVDNIVVADCGADPNYIFDDLENLVRKAKIDMAIDIKLITGQNVNFTTADKIKSKTSCAPLLKATISYPALNGLPAKTGELIIVKPHLLKNMDLATACYAERHADFPQQTTGDQFFDEEQWEAYHQLGLLAGKAIP